MAGLVPAIHVLLIGPANSRPMAGGWVYIMTNRPSGTLYVGVTNDLVRRVWEHREDLGGLFTRRYGLHRLVYFERYDDIRTAIQRETSLKRWPRAWKVRLLAAENPEWDDLYPGLLG
jgi:putative endonuclease